MDFIEVVSQTAPTFPERELIFGHCFDLGAQESVQFDDGRDTGALELEEKLTTSQL